MSGGSDEGAALLENTRWVVSPSDALFLSLSLKAGLWGEKGGGKCGC